MMEQSISRLMCYGRHKRSQSVSIRSYKLPINVHVHSNLWIHFWSHILNIVDHGISMTAVSPINPCNYQKIIIYNERRGREGERLTWEEARSNARGRNVGGESTPKAGRKMMQCNRRNEDGGRKMRSGLIRIPNSTLADGLRCYIPLIFIDDSLMRFVFTWNAKSGRAKATTMDDFYRCVMKRASNMKHKRRNAKPTATISIGPKECQTLVQTDSLSTFITDRHCFLVAGNLVPTRQLLFQRRISISFLGELFGASE